MKQMKKLLCMMVALILLCFSLVSCANEEVEAELTTLKVQIKAIQTDIAFLTVDDATLQTENSALKTQIDELATRIDAIKPTKKQFETEGKECQRLLSEYKEKLATQKTKIDDYNFSKIATLVDERTNYVAMKVKNYGTVIIELRPDVAPITVANFQNLVSEKFYDGLIFHRVIENFMIQGGDPLGTGTGGSEHTIKGEFKNNGIPNSLSHERGVISMARNSFSMDSASSQFFICHVDYPYLDGDYAAFGSVIYGMDVVDAIAAVDTDPLNDKPLTDVVITSMRFVVMNDAA